MALPRACGVIWPLLSGTAATVMLLSTHSPLAAWSSRVVMVADDPDPGLDFPHDSDAVAATVPAARPVEKIYLGKLPIDAARAQLIDSIRNGAYLVNYIGHGNVFEFAGEGLLTSDDVASLTVSPARQPIMAAMTCQVANFALPGYNSIGELLILKPDGGVPALWAPTGLSYNDDAAVLDREFFRAVFVDGRRSIGDAVLQAEKRYRAAGRAPYLLQLYSILGDPAMRLW